MSRRRTLRPGEKALWQKIARTVTPLKPPPLGASAKPAAPPPAPPEAPSTPPPQPPVVASAPPGAGIGKAKLPSPRTVGDLDRNLRRRLARGAEQIDGRIDLHGMTQEEAHGALIRFIESSQRAGRRTVLVITGKGGRGGGEGRGILRRAVPHWLAGRALQPLVVSFGPAHQSHGGDGALYVRLRLPRRGSR